MYKQPTELDLQRFFKFVEKTATCWQWIGKNRANRLYGAFLFNNKTVRAHRFILEWYLQRKLIGPECALHKCDNMLCVNPEHLYVGTQQDNIRDLMSRGRHRTGFGSYGLKSHCRRGHEFTSENSARLVGGYRACKTCAKIRQNLRKSK